MTTHITLTADTLDDLIKNQPAIANQRRKL